MGQIFSDCQVVRLAQDKSGQFMLYHVKLG